MVSFNTILAIGALIVGFVVLVGSGGPSGLGQKIGAGIGSGFQQFSSSLASAFTGGLFGGSPNPNTGGVNNEDTGQIGPPPRTGTEEFDPFGNLLGNFKGLQNILDTLNNTLAGIFGGAGATSLTPSSQRNLDFAISQLRPGQTVADITDRGRQGTAVNIITQDRFISNLGGRERAFGSQESLNSFIERFNR